jgi:hypothetical protein
MGDMEFLNIRPRGSALYIKSTRGHGVTQRMGIREAYSGISLPRRGHGNSIEIGN